MTMAFLSPRRKTLGLYMYSANCSQRHESNGSYSSHFSAITTLRMSYDILLFLIPHKLRELLLLYDALQSMRRIQAAERGAHANPGPVLARFLEAPTNGIVTPSKLHFNHPHSGAIPSFTKPLSLSRQLHDISA